MRTLRKLSAILLTGLLTVPALAAAKTDADDKEIKKLVAAEKALREAVAAPDKGIPNELFQRAECIGVFPDAKKVAFVVGGEGGRGVFTCRQKDGTMGSPAFFTIGGPSIGWQAGIEEADTILLIMNTQGVQKLLQDKFTIGAEASAAAGPVGRDAKAATDAQLNAQILSWSRSRGLFAGASLEGIVMKPNSDANADFYGRPVDAKAILVDHSVECPSSARSFVKTATQVSRRAS